MPASSSSSTTSFTDIHSHIIQTHILPHLDGRSLSTVATTSSYLRTLCADETLWFNICKSIWPSIENPRINHIISTFGHQSFFRDSFSPILLDLDYRPQRRTSITCPYPNPTQLVSAIDIRYEDDIIYSTVEFTNTTTSEFLSSCFRATLNRDIDSTRIFSRPINLKVDEYLDVDDEIISLLKESVTLSWIVIDPDQKRAVNLSSIKPVFAWITNDIFLGYVVVLPGLAPDETVECRIEVKLVVGDHRVGLHVRNVTLYTQDLCGKCLNGKDFLVILCRAVMGRFREKVAVHDSRYEELGNESGLVTNLGYIMPIVSLLVFIFWSYF